MGFEPKIITITTNYTILSTGNDYTILVDCALGDVTITLPDLDESIKGRFWVIKKIDTTTNRAIITTTDTITYNIDNQPSVEINTKNESVTITNDGDVSWIII